MHLAAKHQESSEDLESDEVDTPDLGLVSDQDARKTELHCYFMQEGNEGSPLSAPDIRANLIQMKSIKRSH